MIMLMNSCQPGETAYPISHTRIPSSIKPPILLRGINLGNALDAPSPGEWGVNITPEMIEAIRAAGFNSIRVPVRFSAHAGASAPYRIQPEFLALVDGIVDQGLEAGMIVILDFHHFDEMMQDPAGQTDRFLAIWEQLSEHYQNAPESLYFELLNEPGDPLNAQSWNALADECIKVIRKKNPRRILLIGGSGFNSIESLAQLKLPNDKYLIATFHFYVPFNFTHQGASWVDGSNNWIGTRWEGNSAERQTIIDLLDRAASWSSQYKIPVMMDEFGVIASADENSRQRWIEFVAREAEKRNISWLYWEFCSEFKVYDCHQSSWDLQLLNALIPEQ